MSIKDVTRRVIAAAVKREGSLSRVAKRLGISRQAIDQWEEVPPKHVLAMEEMSGVSRYEQRPDIYGPPPSKAPGKKKKNSDHRAAA